ncbi:hypothetical protein [Actinacidiphila bryophytorum]|uniref:Uncharacterized protein n=1 Tax=Actinacidiphila bryophytorum TaxID=1436133 RepID=A0A9W4E7F8_9ACTN|nr:hypothetical protein [Actinacidiphila bryophytorum]MBM9435448.1 hypothetical protein [Actinacidiphila bryophytorum]MBN6547608.1 hypothetical protein [Actinacidiphila bryophytorum]CAG7608261.1 conserved hypothetical protein [Actinacidiphila bryophytorum]
MTFEPENEQLRAAFTEAAGGVRPSPVPLAAIERRGRARRRRKGVGLALAGGLLAASSAVTALHVAGSPAPGRPPAAAVAVPPLTVALGQQVAAGYGLVVWLTADGKYVQVPGRDVEFTPKVDGAQTSGVNLQAYPVSHGWFVSGVFLGHGRAGRVEITTVDGAVLHTRVLQLPGDPGWGAFFVPLSLPLTAVPGTSPFHIAVTKVAVYDTKGHPITTSTFPG